MTSIRAFVRHISWSLAPDREPDAEPVTYSLQCAVCAEKSETFQDWEKPQEWALSHSGKNPSHHTYREKITRPWRTWMNAEPWAHS